MVMWARETDEMVVLVLRIPMCARDRGEEMTVVAGLLVWYNFMSLNKLGEKCIGGSLNIKY